MGAAHIGNLARLMGQAMRKITSLKSTAAIIFINQIRDNINVFYGGETTTTPGGQALKFFSSIRVEMRRSAKLTKGEDIVGNRTKIKITKNKLASPFKTCELDIIFGSGICKESDMIAFGIEKEVLKKEGNTIFFGDLKLGGSLNAAKKYLEENVEVFEKIKEAIKLKNE
jgi:recombination protein RecA